MSGDVRERDEEKKKNIMKVKKRIKKKVEGRKSKRKKCEGVRERERERESKRTRKVQVTEINKIGGGRSFVQKEGKFTCKEEKGRKNFLKRKRKEIEDQNER